MARQTEMLSIGVFLLIIAVVLALFSVQLITGLDGVLASIIALYGIWTVALAGIRAKNPEKYGRSAYSTLVMGIVLVAFGGCWYLLIATANFLLAIVVLILVFGVLAVASALPSMRKK